MSKELNAEFLSDLELVRDVMVHAYISGGFFKTTKREAATMAETQYIIYGFRTDVFRNGRRVIEIY